MNIYDYIDCPHINTALTHSSFANENKVECNERLEFLGDAVLGMFTAKYLFNNYSMPEGRLTKLRASVVCEDMLAKKARELGINKLLKLGRGEEHTGGRERASVNADAVEAVIGAIFLDKGYEEAEKFILSMLEDEIKEMYSSSEVVDSKTELQELIQSTSHLPVEYVIVSESGPAHEKSFTAEVRHDGRILGTGMGRSKKKAEQNAADNALELLKSKLK